jgi:hypothetical protein
MTKTHFILPPKKKPAKEHQDSLYQIEQYSKKLEDRTTVKPPKRREKEN